MAKVYNVSALKDALANIEAPTKQNMTALGNFSSMMNALTRIERKPTPNAAASLRKSAKALNRRLRNSQKALKMLKNARRDLIQATRRANKRNHKA
jgi:hypothetical protein